MISFWVMMARKLIRLAYIMKEKEEKYIDLKYGIETRQRKGEYDLINKDDVSCPNSLLKKCFPAYL